MPKLHRKMWNKTKEINRITQQYGNQIFQQAPAAWVFHPLFHFPTLSRTQTDARGRIQAA